MKKLQSKGTEITSTSPNSSQQNSIAERIFGTLFAATRTALETSGIPRKLWSIACSDAIDEADLLHIQGRSGFSASPNSQIAGKPKSAKHLLPFGQLGFMLESTTNKRKLDDRALKARYLQAINIAVPRFDSGERDEQIGQELRFLPQDSDIMRYSATNDEHSNKSRGKGRKQK